MLPIMIASSIFFLIFGIVLIISINIDKIELDYSFCAPNISIPEKTCADYLKRAASDVKLPLCYCNLHFIVKKLFKGPVYIYYRIDKFYQNERLYAKSIDYNQLGGHLGSLSTDCEPYRTLTVNSTEYNIAPCGTIANTLFNDSFVFERIDPSTSVKSTVPVLKTGIAYYYDKKYRFKNPPNWDNTIKPSSWRRNVYELDPGNPSNNGYENEDLMVWLRPSAFQSPRKLYRRVNHAVKVYENGLPPGNYTVAIEFNFPVEMFGGRKKIIISTSNWVGTNSLFLPVSYFIVGTTLFFMSLGLFVADKRLLIKN